MRVQAKKISANSMDYQHLEHRVGGKKDAPLQRQRLIDKALASGMFPAYCFYNYWPDGAGCNWTASKDDAVWGISVASAVGVDSRTLEYRSKVKTIIDTSLPLSFLVCCAGFTESMNVFESLPHRLESACRKLVVMANIGYVFKKSLVTRTPPIYVTHRNQTGLRGSEAAGRQIDGILIVEESAHRHMR